LRLATPMSTSRPMTKRKSTRPTLDSKLRYGIEAGGKMCW
jgi:hypothetical protein